MNGNRIFIDTNICIYLLNGDQIIADLLNEASIYISFITEIELFSYHNDNPAAIKILNEFIQSVTVLGVNELIKQNTIKIRRIRKLKIPDALIAASALSQKLSFITADKALRTIEELEIVLYAPTNS